MDKLVEEKCVACKVDAPLVSAEEKKLLLPQIPSWVIANVNGIEQLTCSLPLKIIYLVWIF